MKNNIVNNPMREELKKLLLKTKRITSFIDFYENLREKSIIFGIFLSFILVSFSIQQLLVLPESLLQFKLEYYCSIFFCFSLIIISQYFVLSRAFFLPRKLVSVTQNLHQFNHFIRDRNSLLRNNNYEDKEEILKMLFETCQESANLLSQTLSTISNNKIHVHIKHFPNIVENRKFENDGIMRMLCMSDGNLKKRKSYNYHRISENTHIKNVLDSNEGHFITRNFIEYVNSYNNSNSDKFAISAKNWKENYNSLVIVPIRIERINNERENTDFENLGFIFCDSPKINAFRRRDIKPVLEITKAFADGLYAYFEEYSAKIYKLNNPSERLKINISSLNHQIILADILPEPQYMSFKLMTEKENELPLAN